MKTQQQEVKEIAIGKFQDSDMFADLVKQCEGAIDQGDACIFVVQLTHGSFAGLALPSLAEDGGIGVALLVLDLPETTLEGRQLETAFRQNEEAVRQAVAIAYKAYLEAIVAELLIDDLELS